MLEVLVVSDGPQEILQCASQVISHDVQIELLATTQLEHIVLAEIHSEVMDISQDFPVLEIARQGPVGPPGPAGPQGPTVFTDVAEIWTSAISEQIAALTLADFGQNDVIDFTTVYRLNN